MRSITERFALATKDLQRNGTYLAGVSGGRDSVVLVHLLQEAGFENIILCHLNHGVRKAAENDCKFVERLGLVSKMRVITDSLPKALRAGSVENRLRVARQEFFARATAETNACGVFLGHHADDVAETFLWNLLRGSGSTGLSGIQLVKEIETESGSIRLLRPMLDIWRSEIDAYVAEHDLTHIEDETNRSRKFTRNRLRHDILPWLEKKMGRHVRQNLHRTAAILSEESLCLEKLVSVEDWEAPLSVAALLTKPIALQRRTILRWLQHHHISSAGFEEVELIRSMLDTELGPARVNLSEDRQARRRAGKISLASQKS